MGLVSKILGLGKAGRGIGKAVESVSEVFVPNRTKEAAHEHQEFIRSLEQFQAEFSQNSPGIFNRSVNALNRLPRPILALGTIALFLFAMLDPAAFAERMRGLSLVPEPLWWLLGAVVSFYFGARELYYMRRPLRQTQKSLKTAVRPKKRKDPAARFAVSAEDNPVVRDWQNSDR